MWYRWMKPLFGGYEKRAGWRGRVRWWQKWLHGWFLFVGDTIQYPSEQGCIVETNSSSLYLRCAVKRGDRDKRWHQSISKITRIIEKLMSIFSSSPCNFSDSRRNNKSKVNPRSVLVPALWYYVLWTRVYSSWRQTDSGWSVRNKSNGEANVEEHELKWTRDSSKLVKASKK